MCARQGSVVDQLMSTIARGIVDMTDESRDGAVVGVLYPREWYRNDDGFAREIADLRALDPRVSVVVETYVEPLVNAVQPPRFKF